MAFVKMLVMLKPLTRCVNMSIDVKVLMRKRSEHDIIIKRKHIGHFLFNVQSFGV